MFALPGCAWEGLFLLVCAIIYQKKGGDSVHKCTKELALKTAVELTKTAIESSNTFVSPEKTIEYIKKLYDFLSGNKEE